MGSTWGAALRRALVALGRRRRAMQSEGGETTEESGFTLIELMVVLLIMGILMAIAIPTFLGVTSVANDRSTQSNLTNALTSAKGIYAQDNGYPAAGTMMSKMSNQEPAFHYTTGASSKQTTISIATLTTTELGLAAWMTKTKLCWQVADNTTGVHYWYSEPTTAATCTATVTVPTQTSGATSPASSWPTAPTGK